jgi:hypothetical protein
LDLGCGTISRDVEQGMCYVRRSLREWHGLVAEIMGGGIKVKRRKPRLEH